jgi:drug/metabolite transporter (DMT)-like permease
VLLAVIILRERLNRVQLLGLVLSLAAIWLFNIPDSGGLFSPTVLFALLPITLWGLSGFLQKAATNHVSATAAALVYLGAFLPIGLFYALREPWPNPISARSWLLVIALGFFLALGNFAVLAAYARRGKAAVIAPLVNLYPLISVGIALLMDETVAKREIIGIACALASVAALSCESAPPQSETGNPEP